MATFDYCDQPVVCLWLYMYTGKDSYIASSVGCYMDKVCVQANGGNLAWHNYKLIPLGDDFANTATLTPEQCGMLAARKGLRYAALQVGFTACLFRN